MNHDLQFKGVEGQLSWEDRRRLFDLSLQAISARGDYLEIGSNYGLSTLCILAGMSDLRVLHVFDIFAPRNLGLFKTNIDQFFPSAKLGLIPGDFVQNRRSYDAIAFAFVDHDHGYKNTALAYEWLWPMITSNGILAFHDYGHPDYPGGTKFMGEIKQGTRLEPPFNSSVLAFQK